MISFQELFLFALAAFVLVISPGPNMIYLISRSITQGKKAALISLAGVLCGFLFHIVLVSFGLTAILFAVPFVFTALKILGIAYLLYLAWLGIRPGSRSVFETKQGLVIDPPSKLFRMGFFTNVLNPKVAVFYLSLFPQFIKPEYGSVMWQSLTLGIIQIFVSCIINCTIVITAARAARFFNRNPQWVRAQKWFMASVLAGLAVKMAFAKTR